MYKQVTVLLVTIYSVSCIEDVSEDLSADPRLFFGNVTANLLPVNVTLMAYAAAVVIGGSILGLAVYFLATNAKQFRTSHHYGYGGYGYNQYGQYANSRMDTVDENGDDMMKMVGSALDNFQKINDDDNDKLNMPDYFY